MDPARRMNDMKARSNDQVGNIITLHTDVGQLSSPVASAPQQTMEAQNQELVQGMNDAATCPHQWAPGHVPPGVPHNTVLMLT